jgi:hypothetical protein
VTIRWIFTDPVAAPSDPNKTWTVPRNPREMESPIPPRSITGAGNLAGQVIPYEGTVQPHQWSCRGRVLNQGHYVKLMLWRSKQNRFTITDHYGRVLTVAPIKLSVTARATVHNYWDGEYEFTFMTLAYDESAIVSDIWG